MSKFITVTGEQGDLYSLNVNHIIMVKKENDSNSAIVYFTSVSQGFYCLHPQEDYYAIMKLIRE